MNSSHGILQGFTWNNHEVEVDKDGFIQPPELWDEQLARLRVWSERWKKH